MAVVLLAMGGYGAGYLGWAIRTSASGCIPCSISIRSLTFMSFLPCVGRLISSRMPVGWTLGDFAPNVSSL